MPQLVAPDFEDPDLLGNILRSCVAGAIEMDVPGGEHAECV